MTGAHSRMTLRGWRPGGSGALLGRAAIALPCGLEISDIGIFEKDGRRWAQLPAEAMRDADGQPLRDERGKVRYRSAIKWANRDLQERFSAALIEAIEATHGPLGNTVSAMPQPRAAVARVLDDDLPF